ncbi:MAG: hypothetical protein ACK415_05765 [Thermodesulfovibrionales bacterium]
MIDRNTKIKIALPFLLIIISLAAVKFINFKPALTSEEMKILGFVSDRMDIEERRPFEVDRDLGSPIEIARKKEFPSTALSTVAPQVSAEAEKPLELKISMIVVSEGRRMAIVNGLVVKEGDGVGIARIAKIEKNRILMAERQRTRWIYMEGMK